MMNLSNERFVNEQVRSNASIIGAWSGLASQQLFVLRGART